jgi:hypothetical protein
MKLKKGSKEAKAFMAKLRTKRATKSKVKPEPSRIDDLLLLDEIKGRQKKVGAVKTNEIDKIMSKLSKKSITALADFCLQNNIPFSYTYSKKTFLEIIEDVLLSRNDNDIKKINFNRSLMLKKAPKKVGSTLKLTPKETRLGATDKDFKSKSYHKDTKSHNVNIKVVSGIDEIGTIDYLHKEIVTVSNLIDSYERAIKGNNEYLKIATDYDKKKVRQQTAYYRQKLNYYKKQLPKLKRLYTNNGK